jgi:hypothetical protein
MRGIINVFLTPLQVPYEPAHYFMAYQIPEGIFFPKSDHILHGEYLPVSLNELADIRAREIIEDSEKSDFYI